MHSKQITQLLQQNSAEEYHTKALEELDLSDVNLDKLTLQEDPQTESSTQAQIEIHPNESKPQKN
jgi:hypothetical protein